ncbi:ABC transporter ATP-binding protein [bacterium]|nr:ABC transporter ATP-binding protein [bacterium]MBQ6436397.1 ABC transporter ATP-binding protein [bacterium]
MSDKKEKTSKEKPVVIDIKGLTKTYYSDAGETPVLKGLDFQIHQGEFVSIMGPSGSGKSTLMHILGVLDVATSGQYLLDGLDIHNLPEDELAAIRGHKIGFVFQAFNLLPHKSVLENVMLPGIYGQIPHHEREQKARELISLVKLDTRIHHLANQLSGGQQQRVAIARSLMMDPAIILADEPTGNLPTDQTDEVLRFFTDLNENHGKTIIIITHEPAVASYSNRTIILRDGEITSDGPANKNIHYDCT